MKYWYTLLWGHCQHSLLIGWGPCLFETIICQRSYIKGRVKCQIVVENLFDFDDDHTLLRQTISAEIVHELLNAVVYY